MRRFRNVDYQARVFVDLQRADGRTLELEPGEEVELDLADNFEDAYLKPVDQKKSKKPGQEPANA